MSNEIHHLGIIEQIESSRIRVKIVQKSACSGCHAKHICSASESKEKIVDIFHPYDSNLRKGQEVLISGKSSMGLLAVFLAFVAPLLLLFITVFTIGGLNLFDNNETLSALVGLSVLIPWYAFLYSIRNVLKTKFLFTLKHKTESI